MIFVLFLLQNMHCLVMVMVGGGDRTTLDVEWF